MNLPPENRFALMLIILFLPLFGIPYIIKHLRNSNYKGANAMIFYLRVLLGFILTATVVTIYHAISNK